MLRLFECLVHFIYIYACFMCPYVCTIRVYYLVPLLPGQPRSSVYSTKHINRIRAEETDDQSLSRRNFLSTDA